MSRFPPVGPILIGALSAAWLCAGCEPVRPPPPAVVWHGLPVSGTASDARQAGFADCVDLDATHIRCRRHGVMAENAGPYEAAVDLAGGNGEGGFDHVTLWHDRDNDAVFKIATALEHAGWSRCLTGDGRSGDQAIYTRAGSPVRLSMDISYWGKRRIRVFPVGTGANPPPRSLTPSAGTRGPTDNARRCRS